MRVRIRHPAIGAKWVNLSSCRKLIKCFILYLFQKNVEENSYRHHITISFSTQLPLCSNLGKLLPKYVEAIHIYQNSAVVVDNTLNSTYNEKKYAEILLHYRWLFFKDDVFIGERSIFGAEVFLCYRQFFVKSDFIIGGAECIMLCLMCHCGCFDVHINDQGRDFINKVQGKV